MRRSRHSSAALCRKAAPLAPHRVHRRLEQQSPHHRRRFLQIARKLRVDLRIAAREARKLGLGLLQVIAEDDVVIPAERTEQIVRRQHLEAERLQLQIADDPRMQQAHHVGEARGAKTGREFLGDRRAPEDLAPLEHQRLQPRPGEIRPADEPVVAGPDHDHIVRIRHCAPEIRPSHDGSAACVRRRRRPRGRSVRVSAYRRAELPPLLARAPQVVLGRLEEEHQRGGAGEAVQELIIRVDPVDGTVGLRSAHRP